MKKQIFVISFLVCLSMLSCLNKEQRAWKKSNKQNTFQSFEDFIKKFPQSAMTDSARIKVDKLVISYLDSSLWYITQSNTYGKKETERKIANFQKATTFLQAILDYDSLNTIALNNMAVMKFVLGDVESSFQLFDKSSQTADVDSIKAVWFEICAHIPNRDRVSNNYVLLKLCQSQNSKAIYDLEVNSSNAYLLVGEYQVVSFRQGDSNEDSFTALLNPKFDESVKGYTASEFINENIRRIYRKI